jgi:hypothetical protein
MRGEPSNNNLFFLLIPEEIEPETKAWLPGYALLEVTLQLALSASMRDEIFLASLAQAR